MKEKIFLTAILLLCGFNIVKSQTISDQPYASHWFINELLNWNPDKDPDASYNRSNTPLRDRFLNNDVQVNDHARPNEARYNNLSIFAGTSGNPSQGNRDIRYYAFNYWQYTDFLVFWGGSSGEGIILAPNPGIVDAAHRNGVPVLGTVFFPPIAYGGKYSWVEEFIQKDGETFPVADKLIEVAEYYGFDGWFINQESQGGDSVDAAAMRDFMIYFQKNSDLEIEWYDAMTESGPVSWQNQLNERNDWFFQMDSILVSETVFLNFWWYNSARLANSRTHANSLNRSEFDLFAGIDVQSKGYNTVADWDRIFPEGEAHVTSVGFYVPSWTFHSSTSNEDFYNRDNRFWVGDNRDPSHTETTDHWKGAAHYIPANSVINDIPFVTNFCTGHGYDFYINGEKLSAEALSKNGWNNLAVQDILPTWRWIVESDGDKLVPEMDWTDAYYGGNCIKISGALTSDNHIKLYKTDLPVSDSTSLAIAYCMDTANMATGMQVGIALKSAPTTFNFYNVDNTSTNSWNTQIIDISNHANDTIAVISVKFNANANQNYLMKLGRIAVYDGNINKPAPPSNLTIENQVEQTLSFATLRLKWDHSPDEIYYYNIYQIDSKDKLHYIGSTPNNAYFALVDRVDTLKNIPIVVQAVNHQFGHSDFDTITMVSELHGQPEKAYNPTPNDSLTSWDKEFIRLYWEYGETATSFDLHFGTTNPPEFIDNVDDDNYRIVIELNKTYYWQVDTRNLFGVTTGDVWQFNTNIPENVNNQLFNETGFHIYPNPAGENINFIVSSPIAVPITIDIIDLLGRKIATAVNKQYISSGKQEIAWNSHKLYSGTYICQLKHSENIIKSRILNIL